MTTMTDTETAAATTLIMIIVDFLVVHFIHPVHHQVTHHAARLVHGAEVVKDRIEFEHVVMAVGYLTVGLMGGERPGVMAITYASVGMVHTIHTVRTSKKNTDKTATKTETKTDA